ncbi:hypothetical protein N0V93_000518 [Gnomoniopsis smithogilvyi]|uniref:Uncharacterized protein n=1 Tax=Gnomoniopsis smithogilvyi TaxID=1191159 RepID=A0A9W8Z3T5_9PEZI|nr:hypothetical protein N0V93_000518 [Gnomoniopsis smithogilvyi]
MSTPHITLSAAADDRKARLAKLKSLKRKQPEDEVVAPESERQKSPVAPSEAAPQDLQQKEEQEQIEKDVSRIHLSGRNYDAETKGPKLGFEAPPTLGPDEQTLEEQAAELEAEIKRKAEEEAREDKGIDLFKLQPKKPNWDLKRELNKKLEVLNVRTDNAIARLVRERLQAKKVEAQKSGTAATDGEAIAAGMEGGELEEIIRLREREEAEDERRDREAIDDIDVVEEKWKLAGRGRKPSSEDLNSALEKARDNVEEELCDVVGPEMAPRGLRCETDLCTAHRLQSRAYSDL